MKDKINVFIKVIPIILYSIIISLLIYSCDKIEEIGNSKVTKSATYIEKADLTELINKIGDKDSELITLIKSNPISKLKTNSGTSNYYFDTENIMALKNNKNEASYNIPVYIKSDTRANFIYSISIEISDKNIDTKLNILEIKSDGTEKYSAFSFNPHANTSKPTEVECYCVSTVSDCSCCATHADGGCTHPNVSVSCGCSGGGSTTMGSTSGTTTYWSGGSGSGYAYASTGTGIYIELTKKFSPDYSFSLLEKHTIINNVTFSQGLLDFLNTEGYTPINKAFVISMIYAIEDQQITTNKQFNMALSNFKYSQKSPCNIDLSKVTPDPTLPNNDLKIKFKCVFDKLVQSPKFKELFLDIFGENLKPNVVFEIANLPGNVSTGNVGQTIINPTNPFNNTIIIDTDLLHSGNNMQIAKTIIHECIHAYLNVKLCDPSIGMSIPNLNNMEVYNCINQYYNGAQINQNQHNFIYNYMLPTMQTVLSQVKNLLVSPSNNISMQALTMHIPNDTSPGTPFNWNDFYQNLSLNGLQDCSFFKSEIGTFNSLNKTILTTIDQTKMQSYNQYNSYGSSNLENICN